MREVSKQNPDSHIRHSNNAISSLGQKEDGSCFARTVCCLDELEEAVGKLCAVSVYKDSLLVNIDTVKLTIEIPSTQRLELARQVLAGYIGKRIGLLNLGASVEPVRIRLITPQNQDAVKCYK
jgi:hypothetical protein